MRHYQAAKRFAFKRLLENHARQVIVDHIRRRGLLANARYSRSAITEAQALIRSQHELVPLNHREAQWRAQEAHQRLTAYQQQLRQQPHSFSQKKAQKLKGLKRRAQKTASKRTFWEKHRQNKTFPTIVFGGKRQLWAYQQGKLTKAQWQQCRNNGIYCVGEQNKKGNANLRIHYNPYNQQLHGVSVTRSGEAE